MKTEPLQPSLGALIWGYIAIGTAFILPAYSGDDGFVVNYLLHIDGELKQEYSYVIDRGSFAWLPVLIIGWVNFFTNSEKDAFEAVTYQFFKDAKKDGLL